MSLFLHDRVELALEDEPLDPPTSPAGVAPQSRPDRPTVRERAIAPRRASVSGRGWLAVGLLAAVVVAICLIIGRPGLPGHTSGGCPGSAHASSVAPVTPNRPGAEASR